VDETILLVGGDWRPRALVLAQLQEDGYDVTAVETWDEAELLLRTRAVKPDVLIFDLEGEPQPEAALTTAATLVDPARVVVLTAAGTLRADAVRAHGFAHILARPYSVGDVVEVVGSIARGAI
jgi:DNA-binding NtrC family response regulator